MALRFLIGMASGLGAVGLAATVSVVATQPPRNPGEARGGANLAMPEAPGPSAPPQLGEPTMLRGVLADPPPQPAGSGVFDVVRVDPEGGALIAGRAAPGSEVELRLDGAPLATARADEGGAFVVFADLPPSERPRRLDLVTGGRRSETVVVAPTRASGAPLVIRAAEDGVTTLQRPPRPAEAEVTLELVSAAEGGGAVAEGRAAPGAPVRVYAGETLLAETVAGPEGAWRVETQAELVLGETLRVDELAADGDVRSRVEAPFEPAAAAPGPGQVVVAPGESLWTIAQRLYGHGLRYTVIYEANAARVRDADLIFPGQVLDVPALAQR